MAKMWAGRTAGATDQLADDFNSSIGFDSRMYREDITGSIAHAEMLAATGIIDAAEAAQIVEGLELDIRERFYAWCDKGEPV